MEQGSSSNPAGGDWRRDRISPEARERIIVKITQILKNYLPVTMPDTEPEVLIKLQRIATQFEAKSYAVSTSLHKYLRNISQKVLSVSTKVQAPLPQESNSSVPEMQQQPSMQQRDQAAEGIPHAKRCIQEASSCIHLFDQLLPEGTKKHCGNDRLSDLPDALLHHIMSFLPAKEVVCTSLLSRRWGHLWKSVPCLEIDVDGFCGTKEQFSKFVDHLLLLREAVPLDIFRVNTFAVGHANLWMNCAIKQKVQVLEFSQMGWQPHILDHLTMDFTSKYLRNLALTCVYLVSDVFGPLNNACPVLEKLELIDCYIDVPEISSTSLTNLDITHCSLLEDILICTPNLVSLCFSSPRYRAVSIKKLPFLTTAAITLDDLVHMSDDDEHWEDIKGDYAILDGLSHARSLELLAPLGEVVFEKDIWRCPIFNNLTDLTLGEWCMSAKFRPLICLLQCAPQLENLTLKLNMAKCEFCPEHSSLPREDHLHLIT